jgi:hypothetical protein
VVMPKPISPSGAGFANWLLIVLSPFSVAGGEIHVSAIREGLSRVDLASWLFQSSHAA